RLREQRIVMFFSGFVWIWTHDLGDFPIEIAITPRTKSLVSDHIGQCARGVTPEIALVQPVLVIEVEILAGEQIHRQRCNTRWRSRRPVLQRILARASSSTSAPALLGPSDAERYCNQQNGQRGVEHCASNAHPKYSSICHLLRQGTYVRFDPVPSSENSQRLHRKIPNELLLGTRRLP